jgi:hypothetical protein
MNFVKLKKTFFRDKQNFKHLARLNYSNKNELAYTKTLNLPNPGKFELSMKKICENEETIKNVKFKFFSKTKF